MQQLQLHDGGAFSPRVTAATKHLLRRFPCRCSVAIKGETLSFLRPMILHGHSDFLLARPCILFPSSYMSVCVRLPEKLMGTCEEGQSPKKSRKCEFWWHDVYFFFLLSCELRHAGKNCTRLGAVGKLNAANKDDLHIQLGSAEDDHILLISSWSNALIVSRFVTKASAQCNAFIWTRWQ